MKGLERQQQYRVVVVSGCMGAIFNHEMKNLRFNEIEWCSQLQYLWVVINAGKAIAFDIDQTRRSFFMACNSTFSSTSNTNERLHLSLQEMCCLLILLYVAPAMTLSTKQVKNLNNCWNLVYRRIFGFNIWESVEIFICGLGRLDLQTFS